MDVYSVTLGLALVTAFTSFGLAWLGRLRSWRTGKSPRAVAGAGRAAGTLGLSALGLVALSSLSHWTVGHPPDSPSALAPAAYIGEHPAFVVVAVVALAGWVVSRGVRPVTPDAGSHGG